jgi:hypothetical protein
MVDMRTRSSAKAPPAADELFADAKGSMGRGYERIQRHLFAIDEWSEYEYLESRLRLDRPAHEADYATLVDALDEAEDNARRAHRLYCCGRAALEVFESHATEREAAMRAACSEELEKLKAEGAMTKRIANADIDALMAQKHPDEVRAIAEERAKSKRMVEHFERLSELWQSRARSLQVMITTMRR